MAAALAAVMLFGCTKPEDKTLRLINWNIQNGMWDGQNDNYDRFVNFVKAQDPDVCVWCEAQSIWKTDSDQAMAAEDRYLVHNWGELAARYGHKYWAVGGHRDNYPQVITSKYPINVVSKILGEESDVIVAHGAGWFTIEVNGKTLNIVSLHTWPHAYAYRAEDKEASKAEQGGDKYRAREIQYICEHTIGTVEGAEDQLWMMMGDFNSKSRLDREHYSGVPATTWLLHDYILDNTDMIDVIHERNDDKDFFSSVNGDSQRIDYMYVSPDMYSRIENAVILIDSWTTLSQDTSVSTGYFCKSSDHRPILVDFKMK